MQARLDEPRGRRATLGSWLDRILIGAVGLIIVWFGGKLEMLNTTVQQLCAIISQYNNAAPASGNWAVGDRVIQSVPAVGTSKGWRCTLAGLPGTWVSEGNL